MPFVLTVFGEEGPASGVAASSTSMTTGQRWKRALHQSVAAATLDLFGAAIEEGSRAESKREVDGANGVRSQGQLADNFDSFAITPRWLHVRSNDPFTTRDGCKCPMPDSLTDKRSCCSPLRYLNTPSRHSREPRRHTCILATRHCRNRDAQHASKLVDDQTDTEGVCRRAWCVETRLAPLHCL